MTTQPAIGARDLIAFVCELAMLVLLVAAGHGMVSGWRGWALGLFLAFVAIGIWSQWMAPTSGRRLSKPQRFVAEVMLFATTGLYAAAGGLVWWGIGFAVIATAAFASRIRTDP
ncbi:MAG: YrdB family protein [Aeromicrobium sp.]